MKRFNLKVLLAVTGVLVVQSNVARADIEFSFNAKERKQPSIGPSGSNGAGFPVVVTGFISRVHFVQTSSKEGKPQNVVAVSFNESRLPSGEVVADTIYFSGADALMGSSLLAAIGKRIQVNSQTKSYTVNEQ